MRQEKLNRQSLPYKVYAPIVILWQRRIGVFLFIIASYLYYRALHSFFSQDAFASLQEQISLIVHVIFVATVLSARKDGKSAWRVLFPQKD